MRAILTYHSLDESGSPISVSPDAFRAHVAWLATGRVRVLPLAGILPDRGGGDAVALTFDDGFANFADVAAPLLTDAGLPSTVFVTSEHVGGRNDWGGAGSPGIPDLPLMGWDTLGALAERGVTIGAHTRRHRDLTRLRATELADEVAGCAQRIEGELGVRPETFAYPYGAVDAPSATMAREAYAVACTTELRPVRLGEDRALLPRLDMFYFRTPGQLEAWGTSSFRRRLWLRAQGRRVRRLVSRAGRAA